MSLVGVALLHTQFYFGPFKHRMSLGGEELNQCQSNFIYISQNHKQQFTICLSRLSWAVQKNTLVSSCCWVLNWGFTTGVSLSQQIMEDLTDTYQLASADCFHDDWKIEDKKTTDYTALRSNWSKRTKLSHCESEDKHTPLKKMQLWTDQVPRSGWWPVSPELAGKIKHETSLQLMWGEVCSRLSLRDWSPFTPPLSDFCANSPRPPQAAMTGAD